METIPVIDLMHGQVVHARFGQRQHYQPIQSSLCSSSAPIDVVSALLELYPFERLYIADLAAIQGQNNHFQIVKTIQDTFPELEIWLDSGIASVHDLQALKDLAVSHVIGSENITSIDALNDLKKVLGDDFVLSLDFNSQGFLGVADLLENPHHWPNTIIAMTLYKVGSQQGVDVKLLELLIHKKASRALYAAGGVRNLDDLKQISEIGTTGALIASALHNKQLTSAEISYSNNTL
ncbi:MAG TPA: HisA/HisF-related TIM barrel protein [Methylotenera sp.]|nr:HisA/HisF-related TIM barrel protein [Methylotenera sp.]